MERWLPVVGFPGYEVSDLGRVRSYRRSSVPRLLKPSPRQVDGHLQVTLMADGARHNRKAHQLVLEAFVGPRPYGKVSRHLDGIPHHNELSNLEYATHTANIEDKKWHKGPDGAWHKLVPSQVAEIRRSLVGRTLSSLANEYGVSIPTIWAIKHDRIHRDVAA